MPTPAEVDRLARVRRLHQPVVDAERQAEAHLHDEEEPEEKDEAPQRLLAAALEAFVVDAVDHGAQHEEHRREEEPGQDGIEAEGAVHHVGRVRAEDHEGGLRDVGDVEQPEDERYAEADGGIEAADQQPGDHRVGEQVPGEQGALALVLRRRVRIDDVAGFELVGIEHDLLARPRN